MFMMPEAQGQIMHGEVLSRKKEGERRNNCYHLIQTLPDTGRATYPNVAVSLFCAGL